MLKIENPKVGFLIFLIVTVLFFLGAMGNASLILFNGEHGNGLVVLSLVITTIYSVVFGVRARNYYSTWKETEER